MLWEVALVSSVTVPLQSSPLNWAFLKRTKPKWFYKELNDSVFDGGHFVVGQGQAGRWEKGVKGEKWKKKNKQTEEE